MRKSDKRLYHLLLAGCVLGALSLTAHADKGIIIIKRDVQVRNATIPPLIPDPSPTTVNANPSAHVLKQTNELSDGDFASISSGAGNSSPSISVPCGSIWCVHISAHPQFPQIRWSLALANGIS